MLYVFVAVLIMCIALLWPCATSLVLVCLVKNKIFDFGEQYTDIIPKGSMGQCLDAGPIVSDPFGGAVAVQSLEAKM